MDDTHISLAARKATPSLCSNLTLWETDDIEPSDPLELPQSGDTEPICGASSINGGTRGILAQDFTFPVRHIRTARHASNQPEASNSTSHRKPPHGQTLDEKMQSFHFSRRQIGAQGPTGYTFDLAGTYRQQESTSTCLDNSVPRTISKASVQKEPSEMSFLDIHSDGNATVSYNNDDGEAKSIRGLAVHAIEDRCPLLAAAFEHRTSGPQLYLEVLTDLTAAPFLRYLYTGSYTLICQSDGVYGDVPTSLLLHCQLYHLGTIYDIPGLIEQASVNIIRQCEFGCSSPDPPLQLSEAIRYAYKHLSTHSDVLDTIINYCVACFLRHRLAENETFKQVAFELKPFHQALCQESMKRGFENETASAIIQMPFKRDTPATYLSREDVAPTRFRRVENLGNKQTPHSTQAPAALGALQQRNEKALSNRNLSLRISMGEITLESSGSPSFRASDRPSTCSPTSRGLSPRRDHRPSSGELCSGVADSMDNTGVAEPSLDSDYELVPRPAEVEAVSSGYESDRPFLSPTGTTSPLPVRRRGIAGSWNSSRRSSHSDHASDSSDSEWSLL